MDLGVRDPAFSVILSPINPIFQAIDRKCSTAHGFEKAQARFLHIVHSIMR